MNTKGLPNNKCLLLDDELSALGTDYTLKELLAQCLQQIRPVLPIQNPMPFFVHNNPIQHWEQYSFEHGIEQACLLYERAGTKSSRKFIREFEDLIIPIISSYLDQGLNRWPIQKNKGLWIWFCDYLQSTSRIKSPILNLLKIKQTDYRIYGAEQTLLDLLMLKQPNPKDWLGYLLTLAMHFKGWSGMINVLENNADLYPIEKKTISLLDWLTILTIFDDAFGENNFYANAEHRKQRSLVFKSRLDNIKQNENKYYTEVITQLRSHLQIHLQNQQKSTIAIKTDLPIAQVFFCIDDREESLRRYLEEQNPQIETFGTVGFFGIDVKLKLHGQVLYQPHCPPVIQPRKTAEEKMILTVSSGLATNTNLFFSSLNHTRFTFYEPIISLFSPLIYFFSLLLRSCNSLIYNHFKKYLLSAVSPHKKEIHYEFLPKESYNNAEKVKIVFDILKSAGLFERFASTVVIMAHGSTTANNPFQKSYGCGACGGQTGYPNAKIFCEFANDTQVREYLAKQGYPIPATTLFVPALHDTCSDEVHFDESKVSSSEHRQILKLLKDNFEHALKNNIKHRFSAFNISPYDNPKARSLDWSQVRPEYGHSKVALSIFAPRELTHNLDLKRRAFLISYDPSIDTDGSLLEYVILNALPVCANINLDYFTSKAFPEAFSSGSKLPMNIAAGIGLMTGSKSDLRIGLAQQMVDQHQELRLLSFVYCSKEHLDKVIAKSARLKNIINHNWIHLIRIDPTDYSFEAMTKEIENVFANNPAY